MSHPIIHSHLTQIFAKHYKLAATNAAEEASRFLEILELYDMQLIQGDWVRAPEPIVIHEVAKSGWELAIQKIKDIEDAGRTPWDSYELKD